MPLIIRWERGVINRFMYSIAMLSPASRGPAPDLSAWNGKLLYSFSGEVAIGRSGRRERRRHAPPRRPRPRLRRHLLVRYADEHALQPPARRRDGDHGQGPLCLRLRRAEYTIGVGGSGGAIQQYVYGQNHKGLLDGGVPQYSYSDMVTQTIHVGDCELLERWADSKVIADPLSMWRTWVNRFLIEARHLATVADPFAPTMPYSGPAPASASTAGAGSLPLALNPHFGTAPGYNPAVHGPRRVDALGRPREHLRQDETGFARSPWDNVGVQYGLGAPRRHHHPGAVPRPERQRRLVERAETWSRRVAVRAGGLSGSIDVWSARNMSLSPDGGATPAARREGDRAAQYAPTAPGWSSAASSTSR